MMDVAKAIWGRTDYQCEQLERANKDGEQHSTKDAKAQLDAAFRKFRAAPGANNFLMLERAMAFYQGAHHTCM